MLSREEVAKDTAIWEATGLIVWPRSDAADAAYTSATQGDVGTDEDIPRPNQGRWTSVIAADLARFFDKPEISPSGRKWYLRSFPQGYRFHFKNKGQRRRFFLLAGPTKRFNSIADFSIHARWLLTDPDLDVSNCFCKPCCKATGGTTAQRGSSFRQASSTPNFHSPAPVTWPHGLMPVPFKVTCQPPPPRSPGPPAPYMVPSHVQRDKELPRQLEPGKHEGFRVGELCWVKLPRPIEANDSAESKRIEHWPARVTRRTFQVLRGELDSNAKVKQQKQCEIQLLITQEIVTIPEADLLAGITVCVPPGLSSVTFGSLDDKPWLTTRQFPDFRLMTPSLKPLPPHEIMATAFVWAIHTINLARSCFVLTDEFSRAPARLPPPPTLSLVAKSPASSPANAALHGLVDDNRYCQGAYIGLERVWVGDLVRLDVTQADLEYLIGELDDRDTVEGVKPDASLSYIMHVKAIYMPKPARKLHPEEAPQSTGLAGANGFGTVRPATRPHEEHEQEEEKEELDAWSTRVRVAGDVYRVVGQATLAFAQRTTVEDVTMGDSTAKSGTRSKFLWPLRGFIAQEVTPPISDLLPEGFEAQRITRGRAEVECGMHQIAGRLYTSTAPKDVSVNDVALEREQHPTGAMSEYKRSLLTLAGLLSGSNVKMGCTTLYNDIKTVWVLSHKVAKVSIRNFVKAPVSMPHSKGDEDDSMQDILVDDILQSSETEAQAKRKQPIAESDNQDDSPLLSQLSGTPGTHTVALLHKKPANDSSSAAPPPSKKPRLSIDAVAPSTPMGKEGNSTSAPPSNAAAGTDAGSKDTPNAQLANSVRDLVADVSSSSSESRRMELDKTDDEGPRRARRTTRSMSKSRPASPAPMEVHETTKHPEDTITEPSRGRSPASRVPSGAISPVEDTVDHEELPRPPAVRTRPRARSRAKSIALSGVDTPGPASSSNKITAITTDEEEPPANRKRSESLYKAHSESPSKVASPPVQEASDVNVPERDAVRSSSASVGAVSATTAGAKPVEAAESVPAPTMAPVAAPLTAPPDSAGASDPSPSVSTTSPAMEASKSAAAPSSVSKSASTADATTAPTDGPKTDAEELALPPGWKRKTSRKDGKTYYANVDLRKTAWHYADTFKISKEAANEEAKTSTDADAS